MDNFLFIFSFDCTLNYSVMTTEELFFGIWIKREKKLKCFNKKKIMWSAFPCLHQVSCGGALHSLHMRNSLIAIFFLKEDIWGKVSS